MTVFVLDDAPEHVVAAAADTFALAAAALDVVRQRYPVYPDASQTLRDRLTALAAAAAALRDAAAVPAITAETMAVTRDLADAMPAATAAAAMLELADSLAPPLTGLSRSPSMTAAAANAAAALRIGRLAALTAWAEAVVRIVYPARPDGVTARANVAARFQDELELCIGAADADLFIAIQSLRNATVDYLTRLIADLKPVVTVETAQPRPSLALAWRLYADPLRATELVARNAVRHPSFMPTTLEALAA